MEDKDRIARLYMRQRDRVIKELVRRLGVHNLAAIEAAIKQADILKDFEAVVDELYMKLVTEGVTLPLERTVPMSLKASVQDEWAAVARHQDDVQRMADYERAIVQKEQQQRYKMELDALIQYKRSSQTDEVQKNDVKLVKDLAERDLKLTSEYRRGEQQKKAIAQQFENEGLGYAAYKQSMMKNQRSEEQRMYMEALQREQQAQAERDRQGAEIKRRQIEEMKNFNDKQAYYKQRDQQLQKIEDMDYAKAEFRHRNTEELRRQKIMQEYSESCLKTPMSYNSKVEEYKQRVKNSTQERWFLQSRSEYRQAVNTEFQTQLARQSIEREAAKQTAVTDKQRLAAEMAEQLRKIRAEDEAERNLRRSMQRNYQSVLDLQAIDQKRVKQESCMMTDNERRINQEDLFNYMSRSPRLEAKVPGLSSVSSGSQSDRGVAMSTPRSQSVLDSVFTRQASTILSGRGAVL
mmetsp:Transcript_9815/g.19324  ORF Transcript_9815/g.19324 Transcript_9815/m.19324 type:complete len:463 (-) Transcript_9815:2823-4211(-)